MMIKIVHACDVTLEHSANEHESAAQYDVPVGFWHVATVTTRWQFFHDDEERVLEPEGYAVAV